MLIWGKFSFLIFLFEQQQLTQYRDEIVNHNRYRTSGGYLFGENLKVAQELPAWPKGKDVMFKLHAPDNTTVEVEYIGGKLKKLEVCPKHRRKDVVVGIR